MKPSCRGGGNYPSSSVVSCASFGHIQQGYKNGSHGEPLVVTLTITLNHEARERTPKLHMQTSIIAQMIKASRLHNVINIPKNYHALPICPTNNWIPVLFCSKPRCSSVAFHEFQSYVSYPSFLPAGLSKCKHAVKFVIG